MIIGIPKEIKDHEYRVATTPRTARVLIDHGHKVLVESEAGAGSGITNEAYEKQGVEVVESREELFEKSKLIVKVKEPLEEEFSLLRPEHILFCYLHLAANNPLVDVLIKTGLKAIAFETVMLDDGTLPLLEPMSRIAGILSVQSGIHFLEKQKGGKGILLSGVPGVKPGKILVIGGGIVGYNAVITGLGLGAEITVADKKLKKLDFFYDKFNGRVKTIPSHPNLIEDEITDSDLIIGAVLIPGARAPIVISRKMLTKMEPGTVFVDVSIDQGGCAETSSPTNLSSPTFTVDEVVHYCVTNIPSKVSRTATFSLAHSILPYIIRIAQGEIKQDPGLKKGINVEDGRLLIDLG